MGTKPIFIAGIDPGTTVGCCLLDFKGQVVYLHSRKDFSMDILIQTLVSFGKVICVGCDKKKTPEFVQRFAARTGARIFYPSEDLLVHEKKELTTSYHFSNTHEMDALASALWVYKKLFSLLEKIERQTTTLSLEYIQHIQELVIKDGFNIQVAKDFVLVPPALLQPVSTQPEKKYSYEEISKLFSRIRFLERENELLHLHTQKLTRTTPPPLVQKKKVILDNSLQRKLQEKERALQTLRRTLQHAQQVLRDTERQFACLSTTLSTIGNRMLVVKILENLGIDTWKTKPFTLQDHDVLYIKNAGIWHPEVITAIKQHTHLLILERALPPSFPHHDFFTLNKEELSLIPIPGITSYFLLDRALFLNACKNKNALTSLVTHYQRQRKHQFE